MCAWDETATTIVRVGTKKRPGPKSSDIHIRRFGPNDDQM